MQSAFTVREMVIAFMILEGKAKLHDLKPEQRKIVEQALQTIKG